MVFLGEFLKPLQITQKEAAKRLGISYPRMNEIVNGKRSVTPETALRLARFTDTEPEFWLDLQQAVDLWDAARARGVDDIEAIEPALGRGRPIRVKSLRGPAPRDERTASPEERIAMVWPLSVAAWSFKEGASVERRLPRHVVRVVRRGSALPGGRGLRPGPSRSPAGDR
jgi:addiction module HigA family antidote